MFKKFQKQTKKEKLDFLIEDELEAIRGYDDVLATTTDPKQVEVLNKIRKQEEQHITWLKELKGK